MSNNAHELSNRLLNALDNNYNVVDMHAVNEIISILEKINITKELLETTRLGKHVNELRRKTSDPTLARRAKVLVKRWRDLVIPARASPAHTGSNRSSAERQVRRLGGTPLTSPALSRQVVSPAVPSPRPLSRPAWGGYESDSQDVILVDDDPPPAPPAPAPSPSPALPLTPVKRPASPELVHDEKKSKRDKKPKKRKGHSRAGTGTETTTPAPLPAPLPAPPPAPLPAPPAAAPAAWSARNGSKHERRRNGCRKEPIDPYAALVNKIPAAGAKKVKTTKELLEQIQSRVGKPSASPRDPPPPPDADDDVVLIDDTDVPVYPTKVESPLRNGGAAAATPPRAPTPPPPLPPLEDPREYHDCICLEDELDPTCPAARSLHVFPYHVLALHHAYLPGINGTRAPTHPHQFAVRKATDPEKPGLFTSVVPLYKYSDYADDYCIKNMSRVPMCTDIPYSEFAPPPPELPPPKSPPPLRPYPIEEEVKVKEDSASDSETSDVKPEVKFEYKQEIKPEIVSLPNLEPSERLKAPILTTDDVKQFGASERAEPMDVTDDFKSEQNDHRTVERTKVDLDGRTLYALCETALNSVPYDYCQTSTAPVVTLPSEDGASVLESALESAAAESAVDELGRPPRATNFTEWHECAKLGDLIALPYVVID